MIPISQVHSYFVDNEGNALDSGYIYIGTAGSNPQTNAKAVYWDAAQTQPAAQPLRTSSGLIFRSGTPANVFVSGEYSITILDRNRTLVYTTLNAATSGDIAAMLAASSGSSVVGFIQSGANEVATTVQAKLRERRSVFDAMTAAEVAAVRAKSFSTDVGTAVRAALTDLLAQYGGGDLIFPYGGYLIGGVAGADSYKNGLLIPFNSVNPDWTQAVRLVFEAGTEVRCNSDDMILFRLSRNCSQIVGRPKLNQGSKSNCIAVGIVPESISQTTTLVSQSYCDIDVYPCNFTDAIVLQPGPHVGGADSGCFYTDIRGGGDSNTRHVYLKKNVDWGTNPNKPTRVTGWSTKYTRGNVGWYIEVGDTVNLVACSEELIDDGTSPLATPTARYISADASLVNFFGGYSEACTRPVDVLASSNHCSFGYNATTAFPANWYTNMAIFGNATTPVSFAPVLVSSGGGSQGASSSTGYAYRSGNTCTFAIEINVAKGTLGAGNLSISGLPFVALAAAGTQSVSIAQNGALTLAANYSEIGAFISGASIALRKSSITGFASTNLTLAEFSDPVQLLIQGTYIV